MKHITSTTGSKIHFNLNRARNLVIDTIVPIEVSEDELKVLNDRLGFQVRVVSVENQNAAPVTEASMPEAPKEPEESVETAPSGNDDTTGDEVAA